MFVFRAFNFLIKTIVVSTTLVASGFGIYHLIDKYPTLKNTIFEPKTILNVTEIGKIGPIYVAKKFKLKNDNLLIIERMQGIQIDTLQSIGEPQKISLSTNEREILIDIAKVIIPLRPQQIKNHHYLSIQLNNGDFFTISPEQQSTAMILAKALDRISNCTNNDTTGNY